MSSGLLSELLEEWEKPSEETEWEGPKTDERTLSQDATEHSYEKEGKVNTFKCFRKTKGIEKF